MKCSMKYAVILTTFFGNYLTLGISYALPSVFYTYWLEVFQYDAGWTAFISSLNLGVMALLGVVASLMTRRFGFRLTACFGTIISTVGLLITCFATSFHTVLIGYGLVTGVGWGISYTPLMTAIAYYYEEKYHGILLGVTTAGVGTSVIVTPILLEALINQFGWRGALLLQVGMNIQLFICAAILFPNDAMISFTKNRSGRQTVIFTNKRFINLCFQQILYSTGLSVVFVHLAYSVEVVLNIAREDCLKIVSISGIATTISRLFVGAIVKLPCVNSIFQYGIQCGITGAAVIVVPFVQSYELMAFVAACIGFGYSVYGPVLAIVIGEFVGPRNLTAGWGGINVACGIGLVIGAPIAGKIFDLTGDYNNSLYFGGIMMVVSMLAIIPAHFMEPMIEMTIQPDQKMEEMNLDPEVAVKVAVEEEEQELMTQ